MMVTLDSPYTVFLFMFNNEIMASLGSIMLQDVRLQKVSNFEFALSRSLNVKSKCVIGLPTYDFLFMYDSNHMSIPHRLAVIAA